MDEIWSTQSQMIVLSTLNRDMMISQSFLHRSESSRGHPDSGEGVKDDRTGFGWFQTGLSLLWNSYLTTIFYFVLVCYCLALWTIL